MTDNEIKKIGDSILIENIPLNKEEIFIYNDRSAHVNKNFPKIIFVTVTCLLIFIWIFSTYSLRNLKPHEYFSIIIFSLAAYVFFYLTFYLITLYEKQNFKRDIRDGKNKLTSIVINRICNRRGNFVILNLPEKSGKIKLSISARDYRKCNVNSKITLEYLKHSKVVIRLIEE